MSTHKLSHDLSDALEINRVFVTHSAMPPKLYLRRMLRSIDVSGLVLWADACSNL